MPLAFNSALEYGLEPAAQLLNRGFADYHVPVRMTAGGLLAMVRQDSVDLGLSRVVFSGDQPVGAALIARRGWASRLASGAGLLDPWAEHAVLTVEGARLGLEFRRVPLDMDRMADVYRRSGRPFADDAMRQYVRYGPPAD